MTLFVVLTSLFLAVAPSPPPDDPFARGYLGITVDSSNPNVLAIGTVQPSTPAARAGLRPGDVLVKVGRLVPRTFPEVVEYIKSFRPGTEVRLEIRRPNPTGTESESVVLTVRLTARPKSADLGVQPFPPE